MLNIILFGAPGCGKGTQAARIKEKYNINHISTGDVIRGEIARGTELGKSMKSYIESGELAPDSIVIGMIRNYINEHKDATGNIFDGFPRTTPQAEAFDKIMEQHGTPVNLMLALEVSDDELIDRLLKRGKESGRADDSCESVIRNRIDVYKAQTAIVADHYRRQGKFRAIRGTGSIEEIFRSICCQIDPLLEKPDAASVRVG